jgi:non-heme chloroperoxidase
MGSTVSAEYATKYHDNRVSKLILTVASKPKWGIQQEVIDGHVAGLLQDRPQALAVGEGTFVSKH